MPWLPCHAGAVSIGATKINADAYQFAGALEPIGHFGRCGAGVAHGGIKMPDTFRNSVDAQVPRKLADSTIGRDLRITGNVSSKGEIHLDGHVNGDVSCVALVLGETATLEGNVTAEDVVIRGRLIGSVRGLRVTLQAMSHVEGDIYHQSLALEQGAFFEGRSRRCDEPMGLGSA